jgi:hypothetical protein
MTYVAVPDPRENTSGLRLPPGSRSSLAENRSDRAPTIGADDVLPIREPTMDPHADRLSREGESFRTLAFDDDERQPVVVEPYVDPHESIRFCHLDGRPVDAYRSRRRASARVLRPRSRVRESHRGRPGHRRTTSTRAGPSDDSDSDGPGEAGPPARRRVVVDSHYVVIGMVAA